MVTFGSETLAGCELKLQTAWAMPNRWTFSIPPIRAFVERHLAGCDIVVDPFAGQSEFGSHRNDIRETGVDAVDFCVSLMEQLEGKVDAVIFDPPYSPRQIAECYREVGRTPTKQDTQSARLYREVRELLGQLLKPGGIALSFGWQSSGFGKAWETRDILLVQHGGAHNDTICVCQVKPNRSASESSKPWSRDHE